MASCKNYETLWTKYQQEGVPKGISISRFCENHGVRYRHFEYWYKNYFKQRAYKVEVVNVPEASSVVEDAVLEKSITTKATSTPSNNIDMNVLKIDLVLANGVEYHRENLSYSTLQGIIKNMEVLCLR